MKDSRNSKTCIHCNNCPIQEICIAAAMPDSEVYKFNEIVEHPKALQKSETLFYAGESLTYLYAIRKGSVKTFNISQDGEEQITGFHRAGELIGIDALARKRHNSFAKVLEETEVCAIPYDKLDALASKVPELHTQMMNILSEEIAKQYELMLTLNQRAADQRLASFLLNMYKRGNDSGSESISLNMTRGEIGNYLGLALETVSRLFSKFKQQNLIELDRREVKVINFPKLQQVAGIEQKMAA
ncbi:MAG: fumarate/nitrate reduction transcriptional regulator Fnr [Gammaproteobacteria bacterium]|nr:fumarate/nitrate reduction transcriptional regulator Fnr [Gammaproteobacteria bacterium]NNM14853.1 fumarate/nitrate reduction transcriptional regulator Fnr [Gammaproteobacteria bacterium]